MSSCVFASALVLVTATALAQPVPTAFAPDFEQSVLRDGDRVISVKAVRDGMRQEYIVQGLCIALEEKRLVARRAGQVVWDVALEEPLLWVGDHAGIAFLTPRQGEDVAKTVDKDHVRRLNTATGRWETAFTLMREGQPAHAAVSELVATEHGVAVCAERATTFFVNYFPHTSGKPAGEPDWASEVSIAAWEAEEDNGPRLRASTYPDYASARVRRLGCTNDAIIVCQSRPGVGRVECLDRGSGRSRWVLDRPWEFQRGFIGPSVWNHTLTRFGVDSFGENDKEEEARRTEFNKRYKGMLLAGPGTCIESGNVFLITGKAPAEWSSGYLVEASVLEVSAYGEASSIAALPRTPKPGRFVARTNDVVWACNGSMLVSVGVKQRNMRGVGSPGSEDCLARVAWLRSYDTPGTGDTAWLSAAGVEAIDFDIQRAYAATGGMRIEREDERVVRMPIARIDLASAACDQMTLEVPFLGTAAVPTTNYSGTRGPDGRATTRAIGPYLIGITRIKFKGDVLLVTVGLEGKASTLEFGVER